ncbi:DUF3122 domain-containing protein [Stenomitos frigidus]|uniref:DUF3122 domain-containing protein n=1 Tax=Stenomitos frigidus ULC18 TaxID=2107698 RepID=A0A2T1ENV1_9CYAN|nr:DUF3122 domain-containing protein [Stenomitos frigidus]PSB34430.1 hypothetical protein C7B82_02920 [Stenomitos frigidus ULC18]
MYRLGWFLGVALALVMTLGVPDGLASVHTYPEGGDRVMYRSLQTLRDRTDQAWQVVFYKRVQGGQTESIHLRLVGFPGGAALEHPHPLKITTGTERVWLAAETDTVTDVPNVAEYDLLEVMRQLTATTPLRLTLPLQKTAIDLPVPPFVVEEWRQVAQK